MIVQIILFSLITPVIALAMNSNWIQVEINKQSHFVNEIANITHIPSHSMFIVQIDQSSLCTEPYFFVRLSGAALLTPFQRRITPGVFSFYYHIPTDGQYHLEMLLFGCNFNLVESDSFKYHCLPTPLEMVINIPYSFEATTKRNSTTTSDTPSTPAWMSTKPREEQSLVPTRFQREISFNISRSWEIPFESSSLDKALCKKETSLEWLEGYQLSHLPSSNRLDFLFPLGELTAAAPADRDVLICFVGDQHSGQMFLAAGKIKEENEGVFARIQFQHIDVQTDDQWHGHSTGEAVHRCSVAVVGVGDTVAAGGPNALLGTVEFREQVREVITKFRHSPRTQLYLRTVQWSPLGHGKSACPPTDWRAPYLSEAYNKEIRYLARKYKVPLLDTEWLLRPVWDSARDFEVVDGVVLQEEVKYLLWRLSQTVDVRLL